MTSKSEADDGFPCVDLTDFEGSDATKSQEAARRLVKLCHRFGYLAVRGHGLSEASLIKAFDISQRFFALPLEEKMKAPHPPTPRPHRGFSEIGREKVYSEKERADGDMNGGSQKVRRIMDFKESYEIGSEDDPTQQNIWIPNVVLSEFRPTMLRFYDELEVVGRRVLRAICAGLNLDITESQVFMAMNSGFQNQLRLLHYPAITRQQLETSVFARLPAHTDFGTFTMSFQDKNGGLEFKDPQTGAWSQAADVGNVILFNIGTMLQRLTNDYFIAAEHRVSIPSTQDLGSNGQAPARFSIPYFIAPPVDMIIHTLPRFVTSGSKARYEDTTFEQYAAEITKFQYVESA